MRSEEIDLYLDVVRIAVLNRATDPEPEPGFSHKLWSSRNAVIVADLKRRGPADLKRQAEEIWDAIEQKRDWADLIAVPQLPSRIMYIHQRRMPLPRRPNARV